MTTAEFLAHLQILDVQIWAEGDRLRCNAPEDVLTPDLEEELTRRKLEILTFLRAGADSLDSSRSIVPIQPEGSGLPFFGVPGHNGDVFCFVRLVRHLRPGQRFYAFQPPGLDGRSQPLGRLEDLAARFVADLKAFQPEGPYLIGGYCMGGLIAFEVARQLVSGGAQVGLLALMGAASPRSYGFVGRLRRTAHAWIERGGRHLDALKGTDGGSRSAYLREKLRGVSERRRAGHPETPDADSAPRMAVQTATVEAAHRYKAPRYQGRIELFLASEAVARERWRYRDWERFAGDGVRLHIGPDDSRTDTMLREPHVQHLAPPLQACIDSGSSLMPGTSQ